MGYKALDQIARQYIAGGATARVSLTGGRLPVICGFVPLSSGCLPGTARSDPANHLDLTVVTWGGGHNRSFVGALTSLAGPGSGVKHGRAPLAPLPDRGFGLRGGNLDTFQEL